jgi:hypothetical protein
VILNGRRVRLFMSPRQQPGALRLVSIGSQSAAVSMQRSPAVVVRITLPQPRRTPAALPASMFFAHAHDLLQQTTELSAKKQTKESSRPKSPSQIVISEHLPPNLDLRKDQQGPEILYSLHSLLLFLVTIDFLI